MSFRKQFFIWHVVAALVLSSVSVLGADGDHRTVVFSAISFDTMPKELWYQSGADVLPLKVGGSVRGPELSYTGPVPIRFFRKMIGEDGKERRITEAEVMVPSGIQRALFCFLPNQPGEELLWKVYVMDDSVSSFGGGDIRFVNLTVHAIAGVLEETTMRLKPGEQHTVVPDANLHGIGIKLAAYFDEGWEPFFSARWPYRENVRLMVLFLPDPNNGKVHMQAVPQRFVAASN